MAEFDKTRSIAEIIEELGYDEKKVLLALQSCGEVEAGELMRICGYGELVELMNAVSWLQTKGLVDVEENVVRYYYLGRKQYAHKDLPERKIIKYLWKSGKKATISSLRRSSKFNDEEINIGIGWAKRKGWISLEKINNETVLALTERGVDMLRRKGPDERLLEAMAKGALSEAEVEPGAIQLLLRRHGLVKVKERVVRKIRTTDLGKDVLRYGLELKEEVTQLTPELIKSGLWKNVEFKKYDVSRYVPPIYVGKPHPLSTIINEVRNIFTEMGFDEISGNYVESCFWNMDVLFIPQDHPARDMQDTFYVRGVKFDVDKDLAAIVAQIHSNGWKTNSEGWKYKWQSSAAEKAILRTHTTVNTIRYLSVHKEPPVRVFSIERVFRRENLDPTHLPEFHQIEGIAMEREASFSMLLGILKEFYARMGFPQIRFRPSYFPYTEPSLEVEVLYENKWLELGGAGIFRPEVVAPFKIAHPVLAWGLGLERLAMLKLGLDDLRKLYMSDLRWLRNMPRL